MEVQNQEFHELIKDIQNSLQQRIKGFQELRIEIEKMVTGVIKEQEGLYDNLKEVLAKGKSLRRKDYDHMLEEVYSREEGSRTEILNTLPNFQIEEEAELNRLNQFISENQTPEFDSLEPILNGIKTRQEKRELEIRRLLNGFRREKELINESVHQLVAKGESLRIDDFKSMVNTIKERQERVKEETAEWMEMVAESRKELENEVRDMLMGIKAEQERMKEHWKRVIRAMGERIRERR